MSNDGEREQDDQYFTKPRWTEAIVIQLTADGLLRDDSLLLEPSVGKGAFAVSLRNHLKGISITGVDINRHDDGIAACDEFVHGRVEDYDPGFWFDAAIGNPPYKDAEAHVRKCMSLIDPSKGCLALLLRNSFVSTHKRRKRFWAKCDPTYTGNDALPMRFAYEYSIDRRPSFTEKWVQSRNKKTGQYRFNADGSPKMTKISSDMSEYTVYVWLPLAHPLLPAETVRRWIDVPEAA
jgi:hypothetical protein